MPDIEKLKQEAEEARQKVIANSAKYGLQYPEEFISLLFDAHVKQITLQAAEKEVDAHKYDVAFRKAEIAALNDEIKRSKLPQLIAEQCGYAAPIADDGWIKWEGGARPMANYAIVEVKLRDGDIRKGCVENFRWHYLGSEFAYGDIIAYRIIQPAADRVGEP